MNTLIRFVLIAGLSSIAICYPISKPQELGDTITFLRKFGYIPQTNGNGSSETLYSEQTLSHAVKEMQRFGGLPQTGKLDEPTLALMEMPRCGNHDINPQSSNRSERFTLGSHGWNKRKLSYALVSSTPQLSLSYVHSSLRKALDLWATYSNLKFVNATEQHLHERADTDILISFARRNHGDKYPFDGLGGTLAHAYFPGSGNGGDVHFDEEEQWGGDKDGSLLRGRISFFSVALHELGHSLGLAHSSQRDSVMFPYYKHGEAGEEVTLGKDDIMGMYRLYVHRTIPVEPDSTDDFPIPKSTTKRPFSEPKSTSTTTTEKNRFNWGDVDDGKVPSLCKGNLPDYKIAFLRNELFVFVGKYMWRFDHKGKPVGDEQTYPVKAERLFPFLKSMDRVDAAFEREKDGKLVFISGKRYWIFDGVEETQGPLSISQGFGLPEYLEGVDGAFVWGKNRKTYFFRNSIYWKYNEAAGKMEDGYPMKIAERWRGIPDNITSVLTHSDGHTYFFKTNKFWKFNDRLVHSEEAGRNPNDVRKDWFNC